MHATVRSILTATPNTRETVTITDMEAGIEVLSRGTPRSSDVLLIIVEPYFKALETAAKVKKMGNDLGIPNIYAVANKVRNPNDEKAVQAFCEKQGLAVIATVPYDEAFADAASLPASPIDHAPDSKGVQALMGLAQTIAAQHLKHA